MCRWLSSRTSTNKSVSTPNQLCMQHYVRKINHDLMRLILQDYVFGFPFLLKQCWWVILDHSEKKVRGVQGRSIFIFFPLIVIWSNFASFTLKCFGENEVIMERTNSRTVCWMPGNRRGTQTLFYISIWDRISLCISYVVSWEQW